MAMRLPLFDESAGSEEPTTVCLLNPPTVTAPHTLSYYGAVPPLGLAYVAAIARAAGHEVHVVDATGLGIDRFERRQTTVGPLLVRGLSIEECVSRIPEATRVVGIGNTFLHQWPLLRELLRSVKRRLPAVTTVVGGENASALAEHVIERCDDVDIVVRGEGESTFPRLLAALRGGGPLSEVRGITYRGLHGAISTADAARIDDVDDLPWPAWDLFPVSAYLDGRHSSGVDRGRSMPILTSRGCPYRCTFCSSPTMWTTKYRRRSPPDVVDEIAFLVQRYGVRNVEINDLTALLTKSWLLELCSEIEQRRLNITWQLPSGTRSEAVDSECARALYEAGCRNFCYAPESGSPRLLASMQKRVNLPKLRASLRASERAGLTTHASIIIGMPAETVSDQLHTLSFITSLVEDGAHSISVMVFSPYPGSAEFRRLRDDGRIDLHDERWIYSSLLRSGSGASFHPRFSARRLHATQLGMLCTFFAMQLARRPSRGLRIIRNFVTNRQDTVLDQLLRTKIRQAQALWEAASRPHTAFRRANRRSRSAAMTSPPPGGPNGDVTRAIRA